MGAHQEREGTKRKRLRQDAQVHRSPAAARDARRDRKVTGRAKRVHGGKHGAQVTTDLPVNGGNFPLARELLGTQEHAATAKAAP